ncbi:Hint domain-containing protein [Acetobacter sicerae]|uniref:Hint domain-containing protein n=1 Tax=Acetobacter sicerae TaxID=85325 RepID=UPI00156A9178|nr:Hint domain-containing protein [Acetobacter sicerae]NHN92839.1 hypothetical protein [Acetobacter sicerae]
MTTISSGSSVDVTSGTTSSDMIILSGGTGIIDDGATASGTEIQTGGREVVMSGGEEDGALISGGILAVVSGGIISGGTAMDGGSVAVAEGGTENGLTLVDGIEMVVGGSSLLASVSADAIQILQSGGMADGADVSGQQLIGSGGVSQNAVIESGGVDVVQADGMTIGVTIMGYGGEIILSGGVSENAMLVDDGAMETVSAGGALISASLYAGTTVVADGGVESASLLQGGTETVQSGGSSLNTTIAWGGTEAVEDGGTVLSAIVQEAGMLQLDQGAVAIDTDIQSGGTQTVASGAVASNVTVENQGLLIADDVSAIQGATLQGGAQVDIADIAWNASETVTITTDKGLVISDGSSSWTLDLADASGGTQASLSAADDGSVLVTIVASQTTSGGVIGNGAIDVVSSGMAASSMEIASGGTEIVQAGGTAVGTVIDDGGAEYVLSNGMLINATLAGNAQEVLVSGAQVSGTIIQSGAAEIIVSGATASDADVQAGGTQVVSSGGTTVNLTIESGGSATIAAQGATNRGGTAINTTVKSGGAIAFGHNGVEIVSGGTDSGVTIDDGWEQIQTGGTAFNDILTGGTYAGVVGGTDVGLTMSGSGNREYVGSDPLTGATGAGLSEQTAVGSGSTQYVYAQGTSVDAQVAGIQTVSSGGKVIDATILAGGSASVAGTSFNMTVATGGDATIRSGAIEIVSSGMDSGVTLSGGVLEVTTGGVATGDMLIAGAQAGVAGGTAIGLSLSDGATETVGFDTHTSAVAAGVSSDTKIGASAIQTVGSGGTAIGADIVSGGAEIVLSGGLSSAADIETGGLLIADDASEIASAALGSGGSINIRDQAWASGATGSIGSDGTLTVTEGGKSWTLNLSPREAGATVELSSAGDGSTLISVSDLPPGFFADTLVSSGAILDVKSGQTVSSVAVLSGGTEIVESGGHASATTVMGNAVVSQGGVDVGMTISSGGSASIAAGGTTVNMTVLSGGSETYGHNGIEIVSGGTDANVSLSNAYVDVETGGTSFGDMLLDNTWGGVVGGTDINTTIRGAGSRETVGYDLRTKASGKGVSISTQIGSGATQTVYSGSTATSAVVSAGGTEIIMSGGTAVGTVVLSGGMEIVSSGSNGGTSINTTVETGGKIIMYHDAVEIVSGGTDLNVTLDDGWVDIQSGGTSFNDRLTGGTWEGVVGGTNIDMTMVDDGNIEYVGYDRLTGATGSGLSIHTTIGSGSTQVVEVQGTATGAVVQSGGTQIVQSGGIATDTLIQSGGTAFVSAGAQVSGLHLDSGAVLSAADAQTLSGLSVDNGATVVLEDVAWDSAVAASINSAGDLVVQSGGSSWTVDLGEGTFGGTVELSSAANGGLDVELTCFLAGALIQMADGTEKRVETIKQTDQVMAFTRSGEESRSVIWAGRMRHTVKTDLPDDSAGWPVRIVAGALGEGVPHSDFLVTPEHCLLIEDHFVPVRMLVNGRTIRYDRTLPVYDYYHIETDSHSVIRASGALTESFLDTGHKRTFTQDGRLVTIGSRVLDWQTDAAAPLNTDRCFVEPHYRAIESRAIQLGVPVKEKIAQITHDPDLKIVLPSGEEVRSRSGLGTDTVFFALPAGAHDIRIVSRAARPADTIGPFLDDRRHLGVCVGEITYYQAGITHPVTSHLEQSALPGWHAPEGDRCWTDGAAVLSLDHAAVDKGGLLALQIVAGGPWPVSEEGDQEKDHRAA